MPTGPGRAVGRLEAGTVAGRQHRELVERDLEPEAARLDVRLFERPVVEEPLRLALGRPGPQLADFGRREVPIGDLDGGAGAPGVLDVDADLAVPRHQADDHAVRVREVEAQRRLDQRRRDLGPAEGADLERPFSRLDGRLVRREDGPDQRPGHEILVAVPREHEAAVALALGGREQRVVGVEQRRIADRLRLDVPEVDLGLQRHPTPTLSQREREPCSPSPRRRGGWGREVARSSGVGSACPATRSARQSAIVRRIAR